LYITGIGTGTFRKWVCNGCTGHTMYICMNGINITEDVSIKSYKGQII
jgi:hypothetical protein